MVPIFWVFLKLTVVHKMSKNDGFEKNSCVAYILGLPEIDGSSQNVEKVIDFGGREWNSECRGIYAVGGITG